MKLSKIIILTVLLFPIVFICGIMFIVTIDMKKFSLVLERLISPITNYYVEQLEKYILTRK